jgi:hypothetical protein
MSWVITGTQKVAPTVWDPNFLNVSLLLHGNGTNGSTTITDNSPTPKTVTAAGNAQISTAQSKFGGASIAFDGTGDYLTVANTASLELGQLNQPFTVEFWFYLSSSRNHGFLSKGGGNATWSGSGSYEYFAFIQSGVMYWMWADGTASPASVSVTSPAIQQWHHYAAVYTGSTTSLYLNGTSVGTPVNNTYVSNANATTIRVGASPINANLNEIAGYIDDFRVTKGIARYTSNFSPPTAPFPDI